MMLVPPGTRLVIKECDAPDSLTVAITLRAIGLCLVHTYKHTEGVAYLHQAWGLSRQAWSLRLLL